MEKVFKYKYILIKPIDIPYLLRVFKFTVMIM